MSATKRAAGHVLLRSGISVPLAALRVCWQLEDRGCRLRVEGDELTVGPRNLLTDSDRGALRRWRDEIRAVVQHCERLEALQ